MNLKQAMESDDAMNDLVNVLEFQAEQRNPTTGFVKEQLDYLIAQYNLVEDEDHPEKAAAFEELRSSDEEWDIREKYEWVNAKTVYLGSVRGVPVLIALFSGFHPWISVDVGENSATSSTWNGEQAGSGIPRYPDSLRGNMWRVGASFGDCYMNPSDIVAFLLSYLPQK